MRVTTLLFFVFLAVPAIVAQTITEVNYLDQPHYRVTTRAATYFYNPATGKFSSILDAAANDWIAYKDLPSASYPATAANTLRGVGPLLQNKQNHFSSEVQGNRIITSSLDGNWAWSWHFHDDYARLEITKTPQEKYYSFLYAGPVGGHYRPKQSSWGTDKNGPNYDRFDQYRGSIHQGNYKFFYFNGPDSDNTFWIAHAKNDSLSDHYSLLGSEKTGIDSPNGLIMAGFGFAASGQPLLAGVNTFLIGFYKKKINNPRRHRAISRYIRKLLR